jgi:hypothetical protein
MTTYNCTVTFDASSNVTVEADSPEKAAEIAEELSEGNQHICHHCSDCLDTGDILGVHVCEGDEEVLDTTYKPQRPWVGLTDEEVQDCFDEMWCSPVKHWPFFARAIEAKLKEKNNG